MGRRPGRVTRVAPLAAVLALVVGACGSVGPAAPSAEPGSLVTVETRGGECPQGACGHTVVIERSGRVHATAPEAAELGTLPENLRVALQEAVRGADFDALRAQPFEGECPVNFDGQEWIYTFSTPTGDVRLASCEVVVDPSQPPFAAVHAALDALPGANP